MSIVVGVVVVGAVGVAAWAAAPWVSMVRHGTIDSRSTTAWRSEYVVIPAPRRAPDDEPSRSRTARGSR